ncbi:hypothetical protein, partial [Rosenbergiella collisarenosi]|uniref:hypothetical protein n=1 Tax=Rosenbergiella collisarenosi TaxID=1544695 RepID=UPI001F4EC5CA
DLQLANFPGPAIERTGRKNHRRGTRLTRNTFSWPTSPDRPSSAPAAQITCVAPGLVLLNYYSVFEERSENQLCA